ncbi:MAG: hypothetical protein HY814_15140 [Candidatus Riflebacteria bacterium]|nr:hypothetical protein [Candidatus Riflebacteria bacterium]
MMARDGHNWLVLVLLIALATAVGAQTPPAPGGPPPGDAAAAPAAWKPNTPLGLEDVTKMAPKDNPINNAKVRLGKMLFWDKRLSASGGNACQSCHAPDKGWSDTAPLSTKDNGKLNTRHTLSLYNVAYYKVFFWDGRASSLEEAVQMDWEDQLGAKGKTAELAKTLGANQTYGALFKEAFGEDGVSADKIVKAIATFCRTIMSANTHYDAFIEGQKSSMTDAAKRGWELYRTKARCNQCHTPGLFTNEAFHYTGLGLSGGADDDPARGKVTGDKKLNGFFRVPSLRNVMAHPPFGHAGSTPGMDDMLKYYEAPYGAPSLDPALQGGIHMTEAEKKDLVEFLKALESADDPDTISKPDLP